jgi:hypothetical protein
MTNNRVIEIIENEIIFLLKKYYNIDIKSPILIRNRKKNYVFARYLLIKILQKYNFTIVNISEVLHINYHTIYYLLHNSKIVNNDEGITFQLLIELHNNLRSKLLCLIK